MYVAIIKRGIMLLGCYKSASQVVVFFITKMGHRLRDDDKVGRRLLDYYKKGVSGSVAFIKGGTRLLGYY